jgi:hypothetical protein
MAASITASPNPVGFWSPSDKAKTTISWDTAGAGKCYVKWSTDGPPETNFEPNADTGKHFKETPELQLGHVYTFTLYKEGTDKPLDAVIVTTEDLEQWLVEHTVDWGTLEQGWSPPAQAITDVTVVAGIDTVRISFKTAQPTVPLVTVTAEQAANWWDPLGPTVSVPVASYLPLLGGLQTQHECILGHDLPLTQETVHQFRIAAFGTTFLGAPYEPVVTGSFVTGSRKVTLFFDRVKVRKDGDPLDRGAGDFTFTFLAGDADGGRLLDQSEWGEGEMSDGEERFVNRVLTISHAPRRVWAQVEGYDDDSSWRPWSPLGPPFGSDPEGFSGEGSWCDSDTSFDRAWVAKVFQVGDVIGATSPSFELATGDFKVAFTVFGRLLVEGQPGTSSSTRKTKHQGPSRHAVVTAPGRSGVVGAEADRAHVVGLGADGAIYSKAVGAGEREPRHQGWARVADGVAGPVTVLAAARDRIELFALDADGRLVGTTFGRGRSNRRWRRLGGRFMEPVTAVTGEGGQSEVVGLGENGVVFHRSLAPGERNSKQDDWERIGEGVSGSLQAIPLRNGGLAVFALGDDGTVLYKRRGPKRWQPAGTKWHSLGRTSGVRLLVEQLADDGVGLATIGDDGSLQLLLWRGFPGGEPGLWKARGSLESWLQAQDGNGRASETGARRAQSRKRIRTGTKHGRRTAH